MTDITISIVSIFSFFCFLVCLALSVRRNGQYGVIKSMKTIFIVLSCVSMILLGIQFRDFSITDRIGFILIHLVLFWALSFSYIIGLFGIPLTSLRIQILITIARSAPGKISYKMLLRKYSLRIMVQNRLLRLISSGEIIRRNNSYKLASKWSYFMLHSYILSVLYKLYEPLQVNKN